MTEVTLYNTRFSSLEWDVAEFQVENVKSLRALGLRGWL